MSNRRSRILVALLVAALLAAASLTVYLLRPQLPDQGTPEYEAVTRAFYRGLAALDVGLLDNARQDFTRATQAVPEEPASWANLALSLIRLGEVDAAGAPIARALELAPSNPDIALLAGRAEIARGQIERGLAELKRAAQLDPGGLRTRFAVAEEIQRGEMTAASRREAQALYDELLTLAPNNLVILIERARLAAADDLPLAREMTSRLEPLADGWPTEAAEQLTEVRSALAASNSDAAVRALTRLRNVLARVPAYRESLAAVRTPPELIAEPFRRFLALDNPSPTPDAPDETTTFSQEPAGDASGLTAVTLAAMDITSAVALVPRAAVPIDWNRDFRTDFVEADASGLRVFEQDATGQLVDVTARIAQSSPFACGCDGAWAADVEMDGDLDLVVGLIDGPTTVLRNNGDGTWQPLEMFSAVRNARSFAWGDVDGDADPDAVIVDASGAVHVLFNRQAGQFGATVVPQTGARAAAIADTDADGRLDIVTVAAGGELTAFEWGEGQWADRRLAIWSAPSASADRGRYRLFTIDLDNNGAVDLLVSTERESRAWLADERLQFAPLSASIPAPIFGIADLNGDGRVDLAGVVDGRPVRFRNSGQKAYHWKAVRARAQDTAGDQRINSFGVGGDIEVRSGLLVQKQLLTGLPAHFGLGTRTEIDVARIVWPNGVPQAEFDVRADDAIVAEQRLKGSCPWVFTWDGDRFVFVTDFLWRSPLGLRINAQDTAGTTQTEDWIRIRGEQLKPRDGFYDVRITAELWETHFFDHVSLVTVDHPADVEMFIDERFSPARQQDTAIRTVMDLQPVVAPRDERGRDVTALVAAPDGQYLATFQRGEYQGIAQDHYVEFEWPVDRPAEAGPYDRRGGAAVLIAQGWVYPTDSSINVAIGQRHVGEPRGLALEAQDSSGNWRIVEADLGFPAGKNKTMVIDLREVTGARKLRLRTNLEVYWDALRVGTSVSVPLESHRVAAARADLRYRGFSVTASPRGSAPETADYTRLANTTPRWRDLEGYYTRFGEVDELLTGVDDRYVIMNAGDEMQLRFPAGRAVRQGWRRDFVLIGDGWEKDGDYNTGYSSTVTPLPTHSRSEYVAAAMDGSRKDRPSGRPALEDDPVYHRHREDWHTFHTRYVTPEGFLQGLR